MAKGKRGIRSLKESVPDNEIVRLGEIINEPNYIFPDGEYGITGKYADYSLVKKRIAYRTGTKDDGVNFGKVIEYTTYEDYPCYVDSLVGIFERYAKINNLTEFKTKKLMSSVSELVEISNNTYDKITEALKDFDIDLSKKQSEIVNLADKKLELEEEIKQLREIKSKYQKYDKEIDQMYNTIKEKTKIIVDRDKPKKHKIKEEE